MDGDQYIRIKGQKLFFLFLLFLVLMGFPVLSIFNIEKLFFGIPVLYLYLFSSWFLLIIFLFFALRNKKTNGQADE